jgi:Fe-Mn family superoxide dismutase
MAQITKQWGSLDAFKSDFESKGVGLFGSGWVWLQANSEGELSIAQYTNADNPVAHGFKPILTFDVWEHAYYLDYQNKRAAHLQALLGIVNWNELEARYIK